MIVVAAGVVMMVVIMLVALCREGDDIQIMSLSCGSVITFTAPPWLLILYRWIIDDLFSTDGTTVVMVMVVVLARGGDDDDDDGWS